MGLVFQSIMHERGVINPVTPFFLHAYFISMIPYSFHHLILR